MGNGDGAIASYRLQVLKRGLTPRHREAMRRIAQGQALPKVAEDLGLSASHLHKVAGSPLFQRELSRMMARLDQASYDAMTELRKIHPHAIEAYRDLVTQTDYKQLRFNVAKDIFDRTGIEAKKVVHQAEVTQSYEQRLANVKATYTVTSTEPSPIEVMGGEELLKDYDKP